MTPHETTLLVDIHSAIGRIEGTLDTHLVSYREKCEAVDKRMDKIEEKEQENTTFRNKILGVLILFSVLSPGIYIVIEKLLK